MNVKAKGAKKQAENSEKRLGGRFKNRANRIAAPSVDQQSAVTQKIEEIGKSLRAYTWRNLETAEEIFKKREANVHSGRHAHRMMRHWQRNTLCAGDCHEGV